MNPIQKYKNVFSNTILNKVMQKGVISIYQRLSTKFWKAILNSFSRNENIAIQNISGVAGAL